MTDEVKLKGKKFKRKSKGAIEREKRRYAMKRNGKERNGSVELVYVK